MPTIIFNTLTELYDYINNNVKPNGNREITGVIGNNAMYGLADFIRKSPKNWDRAIVDNNVSTDFITTNEQGIVIFTGNSSGGLDFGDNRWNEWIFVNNTINERPFLNGKVYYDREGLPVTKLKVNATIYISKGKDNNWYLTGTSATDRYESKINDLVESVNVGGLPQGVQAQTLKNQSIIQILDKIIFPDISPTYTPTTINLSLTSGSSGIKEVGSPQSLTFSLNSNKNDAGVYTSLRLVRGSSTIYSNNSLTGVPITNIPDQFGYTNNNNPNLSYTVGYTDTTSVGHNNTIWYGQGDYNAGVVKKNNKGIDDTRPFTVRNVNTPQNFETAFTSNTIIVTGIYPYFWGTSLNDPLVSDISNAILTNNSSGTVTDTPNKVVVMSSGTISIDFNASGKYFWFAHPAEYTDKTIWYVTELNRGSIGGSSNLFKSPVTQQFTSFNTYWTNINYRVYVSNYPTSVDPGNPTMQLRNS